MILTGLARLGRDAEVRYTQDNTAVATLSLAYNYGKKDTDGKRPTQWVNAALWGDRATGAAPYLLKGTLISVVCEDVHIETFKRSDGTMGHALKGRVASFEFAGGNKREGGDEKPAQTTTGGNAYREGKDGAARKPGTTQAGKGGNFEQMDDDIPF